MTPSHKRPIGFHNNDAAITSNPFAHWDEYRDMFLVLLGAVIGMVLG
jgi:hypothetical protein